MGFEIKNSLNASTILLIWSYEDDLFEKISDHMIQTRDFFKTFITPVIQLESFNAVNWFFLKLCNILPKCFFSLNELF